MVWQIPVFRAEMLTVSLAGHGEAAPGSALEWSVGAWCFRGQGRSLRPAQGQTKPNPAWRTKGETHCTWHGPGASHRLRAGCCGWISRRDSAPPWALSLWQHPAAAAEGPSPGGGARQEPLPLARRRGAAAALVPRVPGLRAHGRGPEERWAGRRRGLSPFHRTPAVFPAYLACQATLRADLLFSAFSEGGPKCLDILWASLRAVNAEHRRDSGCRWGSPGLGTLHGDSGTVLAFRLSAHIPWAVSITFMKIL